MKTALKRSRYLLISPTTFRSPDGEKLRCGYASRTATTFFLPATEANRLESGELDGMSAGLVRRLADIEAVVAEDEEELHEITRRRKVGSSGPRLRRFVILPTSYCNMACSYCGQEHTRGGVPHRRVQQKIERVKAAIVDPDTTGLHITWFGGEPLLGLRIIREISAEVVPAAQRAGKACRADVVTNGSLLTHRVVRQLYEECAVRWIEVTVDGTQAIHDRRRKMRNGSGTFEHIVGLLADVVRDGLYPGLHFGVRTNVDNENEDSVAELISEFARRGLCSPRIIMKPAPVHSWGNDVTQRELKRWEYAKREVDWFRLAARLGVTFPAGLPPRPRPSTCVATTRSSEVIDSTGRVYTCTEHPLVPADRVHGQISSLDLMPVGEKRPLGSFDSWYDEVDSGQWQCSQCPFLPVCGGGCPKLWKEGHLPCPSYKFSWIERLDHAALAEGLLRE